MSIFCGLDILFLYMLCVLAPELWEWIYHPATTTTQTVPAVPEDTDPESSLQFPRAHEHTSHAARRYTASVPTIKAYAVLLQISLLNHCLITTLLA